MIQKININLLNHKINFINFLIPIKKVKKHTEYKIKEELKCKMFI